MVDTCIGMRGPIAKAKDRILVDPPLFSIAIFCSVICTFCTLYFSSCYLSLVFRFQRLQAHFYLLPLDSSKRRGSVLLDILCSSYEVIDAVFQLLGRVKVRLEAGLISLGIQERVNAIEQEIDAFPIELKPSPAQKQAITDGRQIAENANQEAVFSQPIGLGLMAQGEVDLGDDE